LSTEDILGEVHKDFRCFISFETIEWSEKIGIGEARQSKLIHKSLIDEKVFVESVFSE
jgi:hypothetical protein